MGFYKNFFRKQEKKSYTKQLMHLYKTANSASMRGYYNVINFINHPRITNALLLSGQIINLTNNHPMVPILLLSPQNIIITLII